MKNLKMQPTLEGVEGAFSDIVGLLSNDLVYRNDGVVEFFECVRDGERGIGLGSSWDEAELAEAFLAFLRRWRKGDGLDLGDDE